MALVLADRVREASTTIGTGALVLSGAIGSYQAFSTAIGNTNTTYYGVTNSGTAEWEVGLGTVSAGLLTRTTVLASSNGGAAVAFTTGTKDVFCTYPASRAINLDGSGALVLTTPLAVSSGGTGVATIPLNNVILGNGTSAPQAVAPSTAGNVLTSNGTTWQSTTPVAGGVSSFSAGSTGLTPSSTSTGAITLAGTLAIANGGTGATTLVAANIGFLNIPQNAQTTAYTLVLADSGKHIYMAPAQAATLMTIPAAASVSFPLGTAITFVNLSVNPMTIGITTDTMYLSSAGSTGTRTLAQYGSCTAIKVAGLSSAGVWLISGMGLT